METIIKPDFVDYLIIRFGTMKIAMRVMRQYVGFCNRIVPILFNDYKEWKMGINTNIKWDEFVLKFTLTTANSQLNDYIKNELNIKKSIEQYFGEANIDERWKIYILLNKWRIGQFKNLS